MTLKIQEAESGNNLEYARLLFEEYAASLDFDLDFQDFEKELANLPSGYAPPEGYLLIALWQGQTAGCVALRKLSDDVCEMKRLYTRAQFQGLGIGRALCEAVIEKARRIGYAYMRLDTVPSMEAARSLYFSLGFKKIKPYRYNPIESAIFMEMNLI